MNNKLIKQLANSSYTRDKLDVNKINKIIKYLSKSDFKIYIKTLKKIERENSITVITPQKLSNLEIKNIQNNFPNKKVMVKIDTSLIAGIKIINNDEIFEYNLKQKLDNIVSFINN